MRVPTWICGCCSDSGALTDADRLREQRRLLTERIARHQAMVEVIDRELNARTLGITLTAEERLEVFGSTRLEDNAALAEDLADLTQRDPAQVVQHECQPLARSESRGRALCV
ncbi:hypothetical protein [Microbispora sp. NPDC049125]|uniref:hypothetical protein n=1 Tax=Microbispora sp. NPDC049125 TaxID=3154929 RepID=UPI003465821B